MDQNEEQLTVALQKITREELDNSITYCAPPTEINPAQVEGTDSILDFVRLNQAFTEETKDISVGNY